MPKLIRSITYLSRLGVNYRTQALEPFGLKSCHSSYLIGICDCPGISQDGLANQICINKSNVARQAAILEEEGFIQRIPSWEDKRVMKLYPTEKTLALLPQIREILQVWEDQVTQDLTPEEKQALGALLAKMCQRGRESQD